MNRNIYIRVLFLAMALLVVAQACRKPLEIDDSNANSQLVLNGVPMADKRAFVNFGYTHFFLDSSNYKPARSVDMSLYVNDVLYTPDSISRGNYFFPYTMQPGDSVRIEVAADGHNIASRTHVPLYPDIDGMRFGEFASPSFNFYTAFFSLSDHAGVPEYYNIAVTVRDSGERYNTWTRKLDTVDSVHATYFLLPNNPNLTSSKVSPYIPLGGYLYNRLMCTDELLDGNTDSVQLYIMHLVDTNERAPFKHEYTLTVENITYERFRYLISVAASSSMTSFFAEQARPYTNVFNNGMDGLGIFAGASRRSYTFCPDTLSATP